MCDNCKGPSDTFVTGIATILWASAWADHVEEHQCCNLSGCQIEEYMPAIPEIAWRKAERLAGAIEQANGLGLASLYAQARRADGVKELQHVDYHDATAERFGECLGYMAMGSGVSWFDDHAEFTLTHAKSPEMIVPDTDAHNDLQSHADIECDEDGYLSCPECGRYVQDERATCSECGTKLAWDRDDEDNYRVSVAT